MGKTALLALAAFVVMGAYQMAARGASETETGQTVARLEHEVLARATAMAGYEWAKQRLFDDFLAIGTTARSFDGLTAEVTARASAVSPSAMRISSLGTGTDGRGNPVRYRVEADIERETFFPTSTTPPVFLRYAMLSHADLTLGGSFSVEEIDESLWIGGTTGNERNASVHTNGTLGANGNPVVRGFGTYTGGHTIASNKITRFFKPIFNPTNSAALRQVPAIAIPALDLPMLIALRPGLVDFAAAGTFDLRNSAFCSNGVCDFAARGGTAADPFVVYVNGTLRLNGGVNVKGFVVFLVNGQTTINGNVRLGAHLGLGIGPLTQHRVAIFTSQHVDVQFNGNAQLYGHLFAGGDIRFNGTADIYGSLTSRGSITGLGNGAVRYAGVPASMTQIFQEPENRLRLISYSEGWN